MKAVCLFVMHFTIAIHISERYYGIYANIGNKSIPMKCGYLFNYMCLTDFSFAYILLSFYYINILR